MRPTTIVMLLWGLIVIPPRTTLMKKRCIETFIASKILRRRSPRDRPKNKSSSTKFKQMFRPSKIYSMPSQDKKQMRKMSDRSRKPGKKHRIVKYPRGSIWQRARRCCCMTPRFTIRVRRERLPMTRNPFSRPLTPRTTPMKVTLSASKQRTT